MIHKEIEKNNRKVKEKIKLIVWNKVKGTYPMGTSKHTNAILEDDFEGLVNELFSLISSDIIDDIELQTKDRNKF
jgi:GTPase involved in cell partitioning and DNA repair